MKYYLNVLLLLVMPTLFAQQILTLWPKGQIPNQIPNDEKEQYIETGGIYRYSHVQEPTLEIYLPSGQNGNGKGMLIFPGGGYGILAYDWEGTDIAKFLNSKGIAGIVVKYRLPSNESQTNKRDVPLIDAQRAIRKVRSMATELNLKEDKIGIIGFSAGGHLASTLGTQYDDKVYEPVDKIDTLSARPDFMALCYPVISFGPVTHSGSKTNLLGENPEEEQVERFSNEKQVNSTTPPTFLVHATDDTAVPVENSLLFYQALKNNNVDATMHIYPKGGHGFSLALKDNQLRGWTERLWEWIESQ